MIPSTIFPTLKNWPALAAIGSRIYRDFAGDAPVVPYIVWTIQGDSPENNLSNTPPVDRYTVSVDVFASTSQQSDDLTIAARNALESIGHVESVQSLGREDTGLWRYSILVDVYKNR